MSATDEPAGLYLHIPFCSAVCPYCDFAVRVGKAAVRAAFVDTLIAEMALCAQWSQPIDTVYFGGGTPSLLSAEELTRILHAARARLPVRADARIFLEANPEDVDQQRVRAWRELGVDTLSLGVQSFVAAELRTLGRRHDPDGARRAVRTGLEAGFATVSVDLIFGLPEQSTPAWRRSLQAAIELGPQHISCYQLTIHDNTTFGRWRDKGRLVEMAQDPQAELFELTHELLHEAGFRAYEVSNFATSHEHRSRHNLKYWRHVPYLGLGPSAHSFDGGARWWNLSNLDQYVQRVCDGQRPVEQTETLRGEDLALETVMLGLRTTTGIALDAFRRRFGLDLVARNEALVSDLVARHYLRLEDHRLVPTVNGLAVADGLAARFDIGS